MRKVVLQMMTTLNGRLDDPDAWLFGFPDDLYADIDRIYAMYDTVLVGQTTYQEMVDYWPGAETDAGSPEVVKSMAHKMNTYKKFVFSTQQKSLAWNNAEQIISRGDEDITQFIQKLKAQAGRDILISGGARLAQTFIRLGLVDEYRFFVYPVVSKGMTWFDQIADKREMELISATSYGDGVAGLFYRSKNL